MTAPHQGGCRPGRRPERAGGAGPPWHGGVVCPSRRGARSGTAGGYQPPPGTGTVGRGFVGACRHHHVDRHRRDNRSQDMNNDSQKITAGHLARKAFLYVRLRERSRKRTYGNLILMGTIRVSRLVFRGRRPDQVLITLVSHSGSFPAFWWFQSPRRLEHGNSTS